MWSKNCLRKIDKILEKTFIKSDDPLRYNRHTKSISSPYIKHRYQELSGGNWVNESDGFAQITFAARVGNVKGSRTDYGSTWTLEAMRSKKYLVCFSRGFTLNTAFFPPTLYHDIFRLTIQIFRNILLGSLKPQNRKRKKKNKNKKKENSIEFCILNVFYHPYITYI